VLLALRPAPAPPAGAGRGRSEGGRRWILLLATAALVHGAWWLLLSPAGRVRHLLPALLYACGALALAVARRRVSLPRRALLAVLLAAAFAGLVPRARTILAPRPLFAPRERVEAMLALRDRLASLAPGHTLAAGWWASVADLEYLLPGSRHFVPVGEIRPERARGVWIVLNETWFVQSWLAKRDPLARLVAACAGRLRYARWPYFAYECTADASGGSLAGAAPPLPHDRDPCFDEQAYLARNPDVARAVREGRMRSGLHHWMLFGRIAGRPHPPLDPALRERCAGRDPTR